MKIESKLVGGTLTVRLAGELDESCAAEVRLELDALIEKADFKRMVLDFSSLTFMDSTGIGMLIGRYKLLHRAGIPLCIRSPLSAVDKILHLSGIYEIMPKIEF